MSAGESVPVRLARLEEKLDGVAVTLTRIDERGHAFMPRTEVEANFTAVRKELDDVKSGRRWAVATLAPLVMAFIALGVTLGQHAG